MNPSHEKWMKEAIKLAYQAEQAGEVPIGAIVVLNDKVIAQGYNLTITNKDPSAHAEIVALRRACKQLGNHRIPNTVLYSTLEPCAMCAGAIIQARVDSVVFGAHDPKAGAGGSVFNLLSNSNLNHKTKIHTGVLENQCGSLLKDFFTKKR